MYEKQIMQCAAMRRQQQHRSLPFYLFPSRFNRINRRFVYHDLVDLNESVIDEG